MVHTAWETDGADVYTCMVSKEIDWAVFDLHPGGH